MVWLGVCLEGIMQLVILDKGAVNHKVYIENILPEAQKYGNQVFGQLDISARQCNGLHQFFFKKVD